jgi:hypothetical protein
MPTIWHRHFFPTDHPWRRKRADFGGTVENREKPKQFTHEELKQQLEKVKDVRPGSILYFKERKGSRRVCLWDLPYWSSLKLSHNLDVMHNEKAFAETLLESCLKLLGRQMTPSMLGLIWKIWA